MMEWLWRILLLAICIGLFVYAYRHTKSQEEIEEELLDHIERQLRESDDE